MDALNTLDKELFLASYDYLEFTAPIYSLCLGECTNCILHLK